MATKDLIEIIDSKPNATWFRARLAKAKRNLDDRRPAYKKVAVLFDQWVQRNFKLEGAFVGGWEPFAAGGRWVKGKGLDTTAKLLQDKGRMKSSFVPFVNARDVGIGSDIPYAKKHEKGVDVPERRMLPNSEEAKGPVNELLQKHYKDFAKKVFR